MSQSEEVSLHETDTGNDKHSVVNGSDHESGHEKDESFEDAVDTVSVRSLTKRSASAQRVAAENASDDDATGIGNSSANDENDDDDEGTVRSGTQFSKPESEKTQRTSSSLSRRLSTTSNMDNVNLDNVNLDDETPTSPPESKATDDPNPASKTLSLSSITSALPAMPWSPPTVSPSSKSPGPEEAAIAASPSNQSPSTSQPPPPPPTRKLTSPFSWLSRSSTSKEKDSTASPPTNARRNTASSIATILSNPEMMLSKLDEENEQDANGAASARNSLKDRFKLLRMQQEAGITMVPGEGENESEVKAVAASEETTNGETTSPTSVPNPTADLAPGTVAGVNAGPSAIQEAQVDWDLWQSVVYEGPAAVARSSAEELNRAIATGIPSAIRGVIWQVLAQSKNEELETAYKGLAARGTDKEKKRRSSSTTASSVTNGNASSQGAEAIASSASSIHSEQSGPNGSTTSPQVDKAGEISVKVQAATAAERKRKEKEEAAAIQKLEKVIRRDLGARTSYSKYAAAAGLQDGLFGVCKAYALYDEDVGYAQGMNFLIMPLLFNMPEQEAFCLLVRLMHNYNLRDLFVQDMPGLHMRLYQFERLLEDFEPALYCHLHRRGISPHLYATQWFLTLFAYRFPLQLVLRIYDLIISEGLSAILRFGIVLMQKNASILMGISDMQQLTTYLKDKLFDVYIDKDPSQGSLLESGFFGSSSSSLDKEVYRADQLVRDATEVKITPETLKLYTTEWEEQAKLEKERETELQELRLANQNYAVQLRRLEERVQACDTEQAALATELVHTKVENQELKDENESLKVQVDELRIVIEKQPTEIEDAWKLERDDLMKRNENVHEENRKLESDLAELEENLVQTKMQYAEINSQHETLNRKWSDLKRQFN